MKIITHIKRKRNFDQIILIENKLNKDKYDYVQLQRHFDPAVIRYLQLI